MVWQPWMICGLKQDKKDAISKTANDLESSYIENKGNGQFAIKTFAN